MEVMTTVTDTYSAKTHLSRLLDQVEQGEEVIITRRGKPVAKLVRMGEDLPRPRPVIFGLLEGKVAPLPDDMGEGPEWQEIIGIMEQGEPPAR